METITVPSAFMAAIYCHWHLFSTVPLMPRQPSGSRVRPLMSHIQFMSGIEWTRNTLHCLDHVNIHIFILWNKTFNMIMSYYIKWILNIYHINEKLKLKPIPQKISYCKICKCNFVSFLRMNAAYYKTCDECRHKIGLQDRKFRNDC